MTSNERKIIKCLSGAKGKAHIQLIARETGLSQDYARILGRSLERAGYIKFADMNLCHLLTKGRARFQDNASLPDSSPEVVVATVDVAAPAASVVDDIAEDSASKDADDLLPVSPATAADDSDLDKALAEVGVSYPFQKDGEASEKNEESAKAETISQNIEEQSPAAASESPASGGDAISTPSVASLGSPEKVAPKEETAKPSEDSGRSFKKIIDWFAAKK